MRGPARVVTLAAVAATLAGGAATALPATAAPTAGSVTAPDLPVGRAQLHLLGPTASGGYAAVADGTAVVAGSTRAADPR